MKVTLEPGKVYILGLNERGIAGVGFQDTRGVAIKPAYLVFQTAGNAKPEDTPPHVLSTLPGNATQNVNPAQTQAITVQFDRVMETKKHGMHLWENKTQVDAKKVPFSYSADGKIFTLNYPLKSSTRYDVEMNSTEDIGFTATNRTPLWPVRFSFTTGQPH